MLFILGVIVAVVGLLAARGARRQGGRVGEAVTRGAQGVSGLLAVGGALVAASQLLTVVPAGHVGVVDFFGSVSPETLKAGINLRNPLARIVKLSVMTQQLYEDMVVPSKEGLTVKISISALFHLDPEKASEVYKSVGPGYVDVLLTPQFRSVSRGVTASYEAKALYTSQRETLAKTIFEDLEKLVAGRGVVVESTPLRNIELPAKVTDAIEEKLKAEQESQRMQFVLEKEKLEAERKRIEARGISDFQEIVSRGISDNLLRWKGIEATEKLASSANAKVVVIGAGKDGLPLILDTK